jgi:hypothetical protein
MHFYCEVDSQDDDFRLVRVHRSWFGKFPKDTAQSVFEKIEIPDYDSDDPTLFAIELQPDEAVEAMSARMKGGLVLTCNPESYGDPSVREAEGKKAPVRLKFEEWVPVL